MNMEIITYSDKETLNFAKDFASHLKGGEVIFMLGDLGSGKTTFTKGIAQEIGVQEIVNSPTFTILKEYTGHTFDLKHIDAYRLEGTMLDSLGFYDLLDDKNIIVIEWPNYILEFDIEPDYKVYLRYIDEFRREIKVEKC